MKVVGLSLIPFFPEKCVACQIFCTYLYGHGCVFYVSKSLTVNQGVSL